MVPYFFSMTVSLNFWFDPKNQSSSNESLIFAPSSSNSEMQTADEEEDTLTENEVPKKREITPTQELALKREIESIIHKNTRDDEKVTTKNYWLMLKERTHTWCNMVQMLLK